MRQNIQMKKLRLLKEYHHPTMYYILLYLLSVTGTEAIISSPQSIILTIFIAVLSDYKEDLQIRLPQNSPQ